MFGSPQRPSRPLRPRAVIIVPTDPIVAHLRKNLARRWQSFRIDVLLGIPEIGADDGARALEINVLHRDHDHRAGCLSLNPEGCQQFRLGGNLSTTIDAQSAAGPGNEKQQRYPRITYEVAQGIN